MNSSPESEENINFPNSPLKLHQIEEFSIEENEKADNEKFKHKKEILR